jgi:hypothetical protein
MNQLIKRVLVKAIALVLLVFLYSLTRLPSLSRQQRADLSTSFHFSRMPLYEPQGITARYVRNVHPQYQHISAWISSVGAAVTLTDLDGNGLSNDVIHVDPRYDKVLVSPAEGTPSTYTPFELAPKTSPYDPLTSAPMGSLAYDFNEDAQTDILVYYWGRTPIIFYQDKGRFFEAELNPTPERWFTNAATLADFDGDGHIDILIANYFPDGSKVLDSKGGDQSQTMQHSMSRAWNGGDNHFFLFSGINQNKASYTEHTEWRKDVDHPRDWTLAVAAADIDGDQLPELYIANDFGPDKLLQNLSTPGQLHFKQLKGSRRFMDIRSSVIGKDSFKGMGASFADINGDGLLDIYVSNIAAPYALLESHFAFINNGEFDKMKEGVAPFHNESEKLGLSRSSWGWESKFADMNNDGVLEALQAVGFIKGSYDKWPELQELAIGNDELLASPAVWPDFTPGTDLSGNSHNPFFVRSKSGRYYDLAPDIGISHVNICRGIAIGDVDGDGDEDFITANQWEPSYLYRNDYKGDNAFLGLKLLLGESTDTIVVNPTGKNNFRSALGASARLIHRGATVPAFVDGGNGHSGKNSTEIFFGLGKKESGLTVEVALQWRNAGGRVRQGILKLSPGWHTIILPY